MRLKNGRRISAGMKFFSLRNVIHWCFEGPGVKSQDKLNQKVHFLSDPNETARQTTHHSQNATFCLKMTLICVQRFKLKNGQKHKKTSNRF